MRCVEDKSLVRPDGGPGFARLELATRDGRGLSRQVQFAKGDPKNPMTPLEYRAKVLECTDAAGMKRAQANALIARIGKLEADRDALAHSVDELQQFEREYRARLKLYFTEQLQALETSEDGTAAAGSRRAGTSGQGADGA